MKGILTRLIGENIELAILLAEDLGAVRTDPARMQQIILNLVLNARDAMPEGGRLRLETRNCMRPLVTGEEAGGLTACVELSVSDTGCGMDAETQSHLFEAFFTTKRPGRGSGLGLATADSIVKQDGGTIQVESEVGRGTRVSVFLPQADQDLPSDLNREVR
jgi:signal transduction histidine kinase